MTHAAGDDQAARLTDLMTTTSRDVLSYLVRRVDSPEDAADLLGEALLVLAGAPQKIPADPERARMWFFGIARRVLLAHYRTTNTARERSAQLRDALARASVTVSGPDSPESDTRAAVRAHVRALPERQRELVALVHWDGFSLAEAAQLLGIRSSTARTHYQKARERLREVLVEEEPGRLEMARGAG